MRLSTNEAEILWQVFLSVQSSIETELIERKYQSGLHEKSSDKIRVILRKALNEGLRKQKIELDIFD